MSTIDSKKTGLPGALSFLLQGPEIENLDLTLASINPTNLV
jgi:hypothetical protein